LLAVAAVVARLCEHAGVRLGRSACWWLPRWPRVCPCAGGCGWGGRSAGGCRCCRVLVRARGGVVGAVVLLAADAAAARLCVRGGLRLGWSARWRLLWWPCVCPCKGGCGWGR